MKFTQQLADQIVARAKQLGASDGLTYKHNQFSIATYHPQDEMALAMLIVNGWADRDDLVFAYQAVVDVLCGEDKTFSCEDCMTIAAHIENAESDSIGASLKLLALKKYTAKEVADWMVNFWLSGKYDLIYALESLIRFCKYTSTIPPKDNEITVNRKTLADGTKAIEIVGIDLSEENLQAKIRDILSKNSDSTVDFLDREMMEAGRSLEQRLYMIEDFPSGYLGDPDLFNFFPTEHRASLSGFASVPQTPEWPRDHDHYIKKAQEKRDRQAATRLKNQRLTEAGKQKAKLK